MKKIKKLIIKIQTVFLVICMLLPNMVFAKQNYDYIIYIGRFQPFHKGHEYTVKKALSMADKVIILCGSANSEKSLKNPWNCAEREQMIRDSFSKDDNLRIIIKPLNDYPNQDDLWIKNVNSTINNVVKDQKSKIGLIGYFKDSSSYYLNLFPDWNLIHMENYHNISATPIREALFLKGKSPSDFSQELPQSVIKYLINHKTNL